MIHFRHDRARQTPDCARISHQPRRLVAIVNDTLARHGITPSRFGRDAVNDPRLVPELRAGRQPRPATRAAIIAHVDRLAGGTVRHA